MELLSNTTCFDKDILAEHALCVLKKAGLTFCAAESCTGGLVCARLTHVPGSSDVVMGGVVSYTNDVKMKALGVSEKTLLSFGAVSENTAREMAEGVKALTGADIAVSVTGFAGPAGQCDNHPVGTVCFGVSFKGKTVTETQHFRESLSRAEIRKLASDRALTLAVQAAESEVHNA